MTMEPSETVRQQFLDAGWYRGRSVAVANSVPVDHPAWQVLAVFGGLIIRANSSERDFDLSPIEELVFRELYPCEAVTKTWSRLLQTTLIGAASVHNDHADLYIASDGRCFGSSNLHPAFYFLGPSIIDSIEGVLLRRRAQPMLRPDQPFVTLYGERFTADSPEVYQYK
jgi:hypothetical protein